MEIFYGTDKLLVTFGIVNKFSNLRINDEVHLATSMVVFDNKTNDIQNTLKFTCDDDDICDYLFVINFLPWLIAAKYEELHANISRLLVDKHDNRGECIIGNENKVKQCSSKICSWIYSDNEQKYQAECETNPDHDIELYITANIIMLKYPDDEEEDEENEEDEIDQEMFEEHQTIQYWCRPKNCNNQSFVQQINQTVNNYYDLSTLYEAFKDIVKEKLEEEEEENDSTTIRATPTQALKTTTTPKSVSPTITRSTITTEKPINMSISANISIVFNIFLLILCKFLI